MGEGLKVEMPSGSGVYSNFADVGGNYSSSIVISELTYGSVKLTNINATMTTKSVAYTHLSARLSIRFRPLSTETTLQALGQPSWEPLTTEIRCSRAEIRLI